MIAELIHKDWKAVMEDDGTWHCKDDTVTRLLNLLYPPESSPAGGAFGHEAAIKAARDLKVRIRVRRTSKAPPGVVY